MPATASSRLRARRALLGAAVVAALTCSLAVLAGRERVDPVHGGASAATWAEPDPAAAPDPTPAPTPEPTPTAEPGRSAAALAASVGTDTAGVLEVVVLDLVTGALELGPRSGEPVPAASMVKLVVAVDVLEQRRSGVAVTAADLQLVTAALGTSDDAAMSELWTRFGGPAAVTRQAARLGLTATVAPADTGEWGSATTSASDVATLYRHVVQGVPAEDSAFLLAALDAAPREAADGFDQGFGLLGAGAASTKQGWACCYSGQVVLHSAGLVDDRYVVAVLSEVPRARGFAGARAAVDAAATAAVGALT